MNNQEPQIQPKMASGLSRYQSAPSSYFASVLEGPNSGGGFGSDDFERLFNPRASSPETQIIFSRFMNSGQTSSSSSSQFLAPTKIEPTCETQPPQQSNMFHQTQNKQDSSNQQDNRVPNVVVHNKIDPTNSGGLIRHSSSPAGLFANINIDEFGTVRGMGDFGGGSTAAANAEASFCSTTRFNKTKMPMEPITEIIDTKPNWDDNNDFPINSWDDNTDFLQGLDHQKNEGRDRPTTRLSHHLSLPKSFGELSSMEKLLQDSVPCKIRAKRGCATHPRSIAERVRRTKISERMRKLQELVPNMEKQTNTSDMLDLAVEYIKDLQGRLKTLSDDREKCSCEAKLGS